MRFCLVGDKNIHNKNIVISKKVIFNDNISWIYKSNTDNLGIATVFR